MKPLSTIFAPHVVAVPPIFAVRDLCRTADGELRHYGWRTDGDGRRRVYISSRDALNWTMHAAAENDAGAMVRSPYGEGWVSLANRDGVLCAIRSKIGPGDTKAEVTPLGWRNLELRQLLAMKSRRRDACNRRIRQSSKQMQVWNGICQSKLTFGMALTTIIVSAII